MDRETAAFLFRELVAAWGGEGLMDLRPRTRRRRLPGLTRVLLGSHNYKHIICHPTMAPAEPVVRLARSVWAHIQFSERGSTQA